MSATKPLLTIELVPQSQWFDNLRSQLTRSQWDKLRKACYARAGHRCEICNGVGRKHPVECHEIWHFDDDKQLQRLDGLIALCPSCHQVKHIGFAFSRGKGPAALGHLAKINDWNLEQASKYADIAFKMWKLRSSLSYTLDLSWLDDAQTYIDSAEKSKRQATSDRAQQALEIIARQRTAKAQRASDERTERPAPTQYGAWS